MQIFELHFNPKLKEDQIFDSFVYEPESTYEKNLGNLYMVGELQNTLPQNSKFLDNLSNIIKKNYYTFSIKSSEKALSQCLKKANEYLAEEVKKENVNWLGNLNFAILSLNNFDLTFTKTGELKILLLRGKEIIDIGKNLDLREIEPYPLKIFLNIVSGKLLQDDKILVLTKEVFEFLFQQNLLAKIAEAENINSKKIKEILPMSLFTKDEGSKVSGICFLAVLTAESKKAEKLQAILFQNEKKFSFPKIRFPFKLLKIFKKPKLPKIKLPKIKIPAPCPIIEKFRLKKPIRKKLILIAVLVLILIFGFLIFKKAGEIKEGGVRKSLFEIQEKINQAENFLIFKDDEQADALLKEAWKEISLLAEEESSLKTEALSLKESIEEKLKELNNLEIIENPELVNEPDSDLFSSPSSSVVDPPSFEFSFDISASYFSNLYFLDKETCEIIKYSRLGNLNWGSAKKWMEDKGPCSNPKSMTVDGSVWILNGDNSILRYYSGFFEESIVLDFFPFLENITQIKTKANIPYLYLLEPVKNRVVVINKKGKIIKQFQSEKFNNLKDLDISQDGKTIYLLNSLEVYKIEM
ncbi:hypothetical protein KJ841_01690 [Patescibacteria group bacterium]|nr:hypothetical protein [Patescibacteria group bacterium]